MIFEGPFQPKPFCGFDSGLTTKWEPAKARTDVPHWEFSRPSALLPASLSHRLNRKAVPAGGTGQGLKCIALGPASEACLGHSGLHAPFPAFPGIFPRGEKPRESFGAVFSSFVLGPT